MQATNPGKVHDLEYGWDDPGAVFAAASNILRELNC
jgi:hypothetical protein